MIPVQKFTSTTPTPESYRMLRKGSLQSSAPATTAGAPARRDGGAGTAPHHACKPDYINGRRAVCRAGRLPRRLLAAIQET